MIARALRQLARRMGYEITPFTPVTNTYDCIRHFGEQAGATVLLDVGANVGQFGDLMLRSGWGSKIVSFEPLSGAHARLCKAAAQHHNWEVAPRMGIGAERSTMQINISQNSQSSSLLPLDSYFEDAEPGASYISKEEIDILPLPEALKAYPTEKFVLKMDVQGYEPEVIQGAEPILNRCPVIFVEMSLQRLYRGELIFTEMSQMILNRGYRCVGLRPGYFNKDTREILQVDGLFVR